MPLTDPFASTQQCDTVDGGGCSLFLLLQSSSRIHLRSVNMAKGQAGYNFFKEVVHKEAMMQDPLENYG